MYKNIYQQIKCYKIYCYRYGTTLLINSLNYKKYNKNTLQQLKKHKKTPVFKEHSYLKSCNPFLL